MKNPRSLLIIPAILTLVTFSAGPLAHADKSSTNTGSSDSTSSTGSTSGNSSSSSTDSSSSSSSSDTHTSSASDSSAGSSTDKSSSSTDNSSKDTTAGETEKQTEDSFQQQGDQLVSELVNTHTKTHTQSQRTKNCQAAKQGLETKLKNLQQNAAKSKSVIDSAYNKVLAYQQQQKLNPAGFISLTSAANAAQANATVSVGALSALSVNLDCTSSTVAQNVAAFQAAAQQVRNNLLTYRKDVVAVMQALESAKS